MKQHKPIYILGTGLSHDGSACLLKDGKIAVAIEKERVTRIKHHGLNDTDAIKYCLQAEGISLNDLTLVVQNANFGSFEFGNEYFYGHRLFDQSVDVPIVTISHHLAHAYSAIGTSPFKETTVLVLDGCGSPFDECIETAGYVNPQKIDSSLSHLFAEKDSFYSFRDGAVSCLYKDFSPIGKHLKGYPMHPPSTLHSIGGVYAAASDYCFGNLEDVGKLMGLAPFGRSRVFDDDVFDYDDGRIFVNYEWMKKFRSPAHTYQDFKANFQYYADIAFWIQRQVEKAIMYVINSRSQLTDIANFSYTGGVALNAVANRLINKHTRFKNVYITPAAGDNGLSIGCAYYGWLEVLKKELVPHNGNSCFGKWYATSEIEEAIKEFLAFRKTDKDIVLQKIFQATPECLANEKDVAGDFKLQIMIKDWGICSFAIGDGQCTVTNSVIPKPDVTLISDAESIIKLLLDFSSLPYLVNNKLLDIVGNGADIRMYFNVAALSKKMKEIVLETPSVEDNYKYVREDNVARRTAEILAEGKVIGWFQEGSEFGPRALGHRSILADPRRKDIQGFINSKVKFREDFRPFAPSVLLEDVATYFDTEDESPYMVMVAQVKPEFVHEIPGVVHRDDSARIQTVTPDWNQKYYDLLSEFKKISGISVLLNTSFNKKGMPIVETPEQALRFFSECALDCIVIGDYIIYKN